MKKVILTFMALGSLGFAAPTSCDKFAKLPTLDAEQVMLQWENELDLSFLKDKHIIESKKTIGKTYKKSKAIEKCLNLRRVVQGDEESIDIVHPLKNIFKYKLKNTEQKILDSVVSKMKRLLNKSSNASLIDVNACNKPLLFLDAEYTKKGLLVYELRMEKGKPRTYAAYLNIDDSIPKFKCGKNISKEAYAGYLEKHDVYLNQEKDIEDIYNMPYKPTNKSSAESRSQERYVLSTFTAKEFISGKLSQIIKNKKVQNIEIKDNEVFFLVGKTKYRVSKYAFEKNVGEQP